MTTRAREKLNRLSSTDEDDDEEEMENVMYNSKPTEESSSVHPNYWLTQPSSPPCHTNISSFFSNPTLYDNNSFYFH